MKKKAALLVFGIVILVLAIGFGRKAAEGKGKEEAATGRFRQNASASDPDGSGDLLASQATQSSKSTRRTLGKVSELELKQFKSAELLYEDAKAKFAQSGGLEGWEEAELAFVEFIDAFPKSKKVPLAHYRIGITQLYRGRTEDAKASFARGLEGSGRSGFVAGVTAYRLGALSYNEKNFEEALTMFKLSSEEADTAGLRDKATMYYNKSLDSLENPES